MGDARWWAKREDLAHYVGPGAPSGAKVRQYEAMVAASPDDAALVVGCSADGAMQVYVAYAAAKHGRNALVVVPKRRVRTSATQYAADMGAEVVEVSPGYPSQYRKVVRDMVAERGWNAVRWDREAAFHDAAAQVVNLPRDIRRVVVPTGSGLTAAGVAWGLYRLGRVNVRVVAVCASPMGTGGAVTSLVARFGGPRFVPVDVIEPTSPYGKPVTAALPDGTALDRYYAAKALPYVQPGDALWVVGRRPDHVL